MKRITLTSSVRALACASLVGLLAGCSSVPQWESLKSWGPLKTLTRKAQTPPAGTEGLAPARERPELLLGLTLDHTLVTFQASTPGQLVSQVRLKGLKAGEEVLGMDFRVARGQLFMLTSAGRLLRVDPNTGDSTPVGNGVTLPAGSSWGVDFNPTVDRIRVVSDLGFNLRLHPDTGAQIDGDSATEGLQGDGPLRYAQGDLLSGTTPRVVAAGYTYNAQNDKITTNYAIDAGAGHLVIQGSLEGVTPVVSPNTGLLTSVGPLQIDRFDQASFDIADVGNAAYLVTQVAGRVESRLYEVDLGSGQARLIGAVAAGQALRALAIVP